MRLGDGVGLPHHELGGKVALAHVVGGDVLAGGAVGERAHDGEDGARKAGGLSVGRDLLHREVGRRVDGGDGGLAHKRAPRVVVTGELLERAVRRHHKAGGTFDDGEAEGRLRLRDGVALAHDEQGGEHVALAILADGEGLLLGAVGKGALERELRALHAGDVVAIGALGDLERDGLVGEGDGGAALVDLHVRGLRALGRDGAVGAHGKGERAGRTGVAVLRAGLVELVGAALLEDVRESERAGAVGDELAGGRRAIGEGGPLGGLDAIGGTREELGGVIGVALHERHADELVCLADGRAAGREAVAAAHGRRAVGVDGEGGHAGLELVAVGGHGLGKLVLVAHDELARDGNGARGGGRRVGARSRAAVREGGARLGRHLERGGAGGDGVRTIGLLERDARGGVGNGAGVERGPGVGAVKRHLVGDRRAAVARRRADLDEAIGAPAEAGDADLTVRARLERGLALDVLPVATALLLQLEGAVGQAGGAVGLGEGKRSRLADVGEGAVVGELVLGRTVHDFNGKRRGVDHVAGVSGLGEGVGSLLESAYDDGARVRGVADGLDLGARGIQAVGLAGLDALGDDHIAVLEREHRTVHAVVRGGVGLGERGRGVELVVLGLDVLRRRLGLATVIGGDGEGVGRLRIDRVAAGTRLLEVVLALGQAVGELRVVLAEAGQGDAGASGSPVARGVGRDSGGDPDVARVGLLVQVERHREANPLAGVLVVLAEGDGAAHHLVRDGDGGHPGCGLDRDRRGIRDRDVARLGDKEREVVHLEVVRRRERLAHGVAAGRQADDIAVVGALAAGRLGDAHVAGLVAGPDGHGHVAPLHGELDAVQVLGLAVVVGADLVERELRGGVDSRDGGLVCDRAPDGSVARKAGQAPVARHGEGGGAVDEREAGRGLRLGDLVGVAHDEPSGEHVALAVRADNEGL